MSGSPNNPTVSDGRAASIGILGGVFSGLLGIGGGTAMVPLLVFLANQSQRIAHALSLAAMIPIATAAVIVYGAVGKVDVLAAAALAAGAIVGARIGAGLLSRAAERPLKIAFGSFLLVAAALLVIEG